MNIKVNWKDENRRLRDHESKIRMGYFQQDWVKHLMKSTTEQGIENPEIILSNFEKIKDVANKEKIFNNLKNASLYAGVQNGKYSRTGQIVEKEITELQSMIAKSDYIFYGISNYHIDGFSSSLEFVNKEKFVRYTFRESGGYKESNNKK